MAKKNKPKGSDNFEDASMSAPGATIVPDNRRGDFLPALFGLPLMMFGESAVFDTLGRLSPDYDGGLWEFLEQDGTPLYLRPMSAKPFRIRCDTNDYEGAVSADAAGIIATLFALGHLSYRDRSGRLANAYARLNRFAGGHPEAESIFDAID